MDALLPMRDAIPMRLVSYIATLLLICACAATASRADVFTLVGGGHLEGKLLPSDEANKSTYTIELAAGGRLTVARAQITKIDNVTPADAEYQNLARTSPDNVEAHWKLAEWCRQNKLLDVRKKHLERILELDPNHAEAR